MQKFYSARIPRGTTRCSQRRRPTQGGNHHIGRLDRNAPACDPTTRRSTVDEQHPPAGAAPARFHPAAGSRRARGLKRIREMALACVARSRTPEARGQFSARTTPGPSPPRARMRSFRRRSRHGRGVREKRER